MIPLQDDGFCFACGVKNPMGLRLVFSPRDGGGVSAKFMPLKSHQGYKDIIHGGIITAMLDEAMVKAAIEANTSAIEADIFPVTAEITVRFREPLMVGEAAVVEASVEKSGGRLIEAEARVTRLKDGKTIASSKGKLLKGRTTA